jgi:hypothetical protein
MFTFWMTSIKRLKNEKQAKKEKEKKNDAVGTDLKSNRNIVDRYKRLTYISMASHFPILVLFKKGDIIRHTYHM